MTWVYSEDGATIDRRAKERPESVWVQDTPDTGRFVPVESDAAAATFGWFPFDLTARPDADHVRTIERQGDRFVEVWTFDQALADQNADNAARDADRAELPNDLEKAKTERDDAIQERAEMDPADPAFLPKWDDADPAAWVPLSVSGQTNARIDELQDAINLLGPRVVDQARLVNLHSNKIRKLWGSVRVLSALLVRKLRADRDDVASP